MVKHWFKCLGYYSPDGRPHRAGELTDSAREVERAVARDAGTQAGHLLLLPGLVLNAPRHICPGAVLLRAKKRKFSFRQNSAIRGNTNT